MSLSHCFDCGREVSTLARSCPHCGRPRPTRKGSGVGTVLALIAALGLAVGALYLVRGRCCPFKTAGSLGPEKPVPAAPAPRDGIECDLGGGDASK